MRAYSDKYAPIFDFVVDVYEYWKYDMLPGGYFCEKQFARTGF